MPQLAEWLQQANRYMNTNQYDSSQYWLNRIHEKMSYRKPSLFSYALTSRQAEVYYYNNLHQLGLQESKRAVAIASVLNNDTLLADAYNFCGLFCIGTANITQAITYFKQGIAICKQPPYPDNYPDLTNPHHLYGNLSEAYSLSNQHDSALYYGHRSYAAASEINKKRGMASALLNLGSLFLNSNMQDSAYKYFDLAQQRAADADETDISLNSFSGMAVSAMQKGERTLALSLLDKGFELLEQHPKLNSYYTLLFTEQALQVYNVYDDYEQLAKTLAIKSNIQSLTHSKNNQQYLSVLTAGLKNETRLLNMEISKARQEKELATTRLYVGGLILLLLAAGFITYRYYAMQRLKVANLRNKISQDLHDEVGATLSGIALYSYITRQQSNNNQQEEVEKSLGIIEKNATGMVKKLNDIVWTVNPEHDSLQSLLSRLEDFALENASPKNISISLQKEGEIEHATLSMDERKNIYLICKEAINNAIKYSNCTTISLNVTLRKDRLIIAIKDNGVGFDINQQRSSNGINNMYARTAEIRADLDITSKKGEGTSLILSCKITQ